MVGVLLPKVWLTARGGFGRQRYKKVSKRQKSEHIILIIDTIFQIFDTMARRKADFDGLLVQEFLTNATTMEDQHIFLKIINR
jgi:hypothetical protein